MKKILVLSSALVSIVMLSACTSQATGGVASKKSLDTDKDKASYSVGVNMAQSFKGSENIVDMSVLFQGFQDQMAGKDLLLSDSLRTVAIQALGKSMQEARIANVKIKGDSVLTANKAKEGVVVTKSGLQYRVITAGTGEKPQASDLVTAHYEGKLVDGTVFDSSKKRGKPIDFPVSGVIPGWTEALQLMPVGSKWELVIPAALAYGDRANPRSPIPPGSVLIFEVELLAIKAPESASAPGATAVPAAATSAVKAKASAKATTKVSAAKTAVPAKVVAPAAK